MLSRFLDRLDVTTLLIALSLAALPVWPRLLGGPASRLEALLAEVRSASARLEAESGRYAERPPAPERAGEEHGGPWIGRVRR